MADKNLLLNHVIEECAEKHSLAALFNEKPFRVSESMETIPPFLRINCYMTNIF
jgi:hypothetical protein